MAVLSDIDIKKCVQDSTIFIESFDATLLGPDSYDIGIGDAFRVTNPQLKESILEIHHRLGGRGLNTEYSFPEISRRQLAAKRSPMLRPNEVYVAECAEIKTDKGIKARAVARSGMARNGIHAFNPSAGRFLAIVPYTFAHVPESPVAQVVFYEDPTWPLGPEKMKELYDRCGLFFSDPKILTDENGNGYVPMSFGKKLQCYGGGKLSEDCVSGFRKNKGNSNFGFYLGITKERFGTGNSCVAWMLSAKGHIYPNAPLCHANVGVQQHTAEVSLAPYEAEKIMSGDEKKPHYAFIVRVYPLKTPTTTGYNGKYNGQTEPTLKV